MRTVSLGTMIKSITGLASIDLSEWEREFVESIAEQSGDGEQTTALSAKQVEVVERIYRKHFA